VSKIVETLTFSAIALLIIALLIFAIFCNVVLCCKVDYSTAKYEVQQMVVMKSIEGQGQIRRRRGTNEGAVFWDLTPIFEYEVRHGGLTYTVDEWFLEWELEPINREKP
jgi:hypothetical protein